MKAGRRHVAEANARSQLALDLPDRWCAVALGDVIRLQPGYAFKSEWFGDDGVRLLRGTNIEPGGTRWQDVVHLPADRADAFAAYRLNAGDIVIAMDRPIVAAGLKIATLRDDDVPSLLLQRVGRFHCGGAVEKAFLVQYLRSHHFVQHIKGQATGTQLPHISGTDIETAPFLLPPLNEQKRIVAKLEELTTRSRRAREALDAVPPLLDQLRQSILAAAFRGDLTADWRAINANIEPATRLLHQIRERRQANLAGVSAHSGRGKTQRSSEATPEIALIEGEEQLPKIPSSWAWAAAAEVVEPGAEIVYGIVQPGSDYPDGIPYVRGLDIEDDQIIEAQLRRTHPDIARRYERSALKGGDVLLGIIRATKVAVVPSSLEGANITQGTARFRPAKGVETDFLAAWLSGPSAQSRLHAMYRGIDMPGLNLRDVRRLPIPVAPPEEQQVLVDRLSVLLKQVATLRNVFKTALDRQSELDAAIVAKAFRGELVPQDPSDDPAAELLAGIHDTPSSAEPIDSHRQRPRRGTATKVEAQSIDRMRAAARNAEVQHARERSESLADMDPASLGDEIFMALWRRGPLEKHQAVQIAAEHLHQTGLIAVRPPRDDSPIYAKLLTSIDAAVKAGRFDRPKRGYVRACKTDATAYEADDWRQALLASVGPDPMERQAAIRKAAEWARDNMGLEFTRLHSDGQIAIGLRSAINTAVRRGEIARHGTRISVKEASIERRERGQLTLSLGTPTAGSPVNDTGTDGQ